MSSLSNDRVTGDYVCQNCGYHPCVWQTYKEDNEDYLSSLKGEISQGRQSSGVRKQVYRDITRIMHGIMGSGVRRKLPKCVEDNVRRMFPSEDQKYMGYKEK